MINAREAVLKFFDSVPFAHFKVYYGNSATSQMAASSSNIPFTGEQLEKSVSTKYLAEALDLLGSGEYLIQVKPTPEANDKNKIFNYQFRIVGPSVGLPTTPTNQPVTMAGYISPSEMDARIRAEKLALELQFERENFTREMKELKEAIKGNKGKNELAEVMREAKEIFMGIRGMHTPTRNPAPMVAIKGQDTPPVQTDGHDLRKVYKGIWDGAVTEYFKISGTQESAIVNFYCLVQWIKANPEMYQALLPQLEPFKEGLNDTGIFNS